MKVQDKHTAFGRGEVERSRVLRSSIGVVNCTSVAVGICSVAGIGWLQEPSSKSTLSCWNREGDSLDTGCQ